MAILNLANTEFLKAPLWSGLLAADELYYQGCLVDKIQYFKVVFKGEPGAFLIAHVIRREEDYIWESARDLIDRAVKQAATTVRGVYSFELLTFEAHNELKTFNYNELAQVLVNNSRILKVGEQVLVKYSSVYGLLHKIGEETWGKMVLKASVEWATSQPKFIFILLAKMLKASSQLSCPAICLVNDLGNKPLYDPQGSEEQQVLLDDFIAKRAKSTAPFTSECYIRDALGVKGITGTH